MSGFEALEKVTVQDLKVMANCSRYNTQVHEIVKVIMILVYSEKEKTSVADFKAKIVEDPE